MVDNAKVVDARDKDSKNQIRHIHGLHTQSQNLEENSRIVTRSILSKVPWDSIWLHVVESWS